MERQAPSKEVEVTPTSMFAKVAELWFSELRGLVDSGQRSPGTLDTYRSIYRTRVEPRFGALRIREITTPIADRALSEIKAKSVSRARIAKIIVSGVMRYAARHGAVTVNPVREVGRIDSTPVAGLEL